MCGIYSRWNLQQVGQITILATIPAYNEEIAIGSMIARVSAHVDEVLVIDDGSYDSTGSVAELMGATVIVHEKNATAYVAGTSGDHVISHKKNMGKAAALKTAGLFLFFRHGSTRIPEFNHTINIFQEAPATRTQLYQPGEVPT